MVFRVKINASAFQTTREFLIFAQVFAMKQQCTPVCQETFRLRTTHTTI